MLLLKLKKSENGLGSFLAKNIFSFIDLDVTEDMLGTQHINFRLTTA